MSRDALKITAVFLIVYIYTPNTTLENYSSLVIKLKLYIIFVKIDSFINDEKINRLWHPLTFAEDSLQGAAQCHYPRLRKAPQDFSAHLVASRYWHRRFLEGDGANKLPCRRTASRQILNSRGRDDDPTTRSKERSKTKLCQT